MAADKDHQTAAALPAVGQRLAEGGLSLQIFGHAQLPTAHGLFTMLVARQDDDGPEHVALVRGSPAGAQRVLVRAHSECLTGDALASLRCDCRAQLEASCALLGQAQVGILLYLRQEGRGIGLGNKVRAYALQDQGCDTYTANRQLGFANDQRDWRPAALWLRLLQVGSVELLTNNPAKLAGIAAHGITVAGRRPLVVPPNPHNLAYLRAKAGAGGHLLDI